MLRLLIGVFALAQAVNLPPAYPRPGTSNMIDNDRVLVWNIAWLKQVYPLHRHVYDLVGVYYTDGDRTIVSTAGERRPVSTKAWGIAFQAKGVTHIEEGASDIPLKAVFVELKQESPTGAAGPEAQFLSQSGKQVLDNARATVWEFMGRIPAAPHQHGRDAVIVSFKNATPTARFVPRGTSHQNEGDDSADRQYVFELK
jgi:hypothetical protein